MNRIGIALAAGGLFGLGLTISDMIDPARVLAFLDIFGDWDPTLAFVMAGALIPTAIAWQMATRLGAPLKAGSFPERPAPTLDVALIGGAALFGIGWGLVGLCPGPAIAAIGIGGSRILLFLAAMAAGMALFRFTRR